MLVNMLVEKRFKAPCYFFVRFFYVFNSNKFSGGEIAPIAPLRSNWPLPTCARRTAAAAGRQKSRRPWSRVFARYFLTPHGVRPTGVNY